MTDIISFAASLLTGLDAQIEQSFSDTSVTLPLIVLQVISDTATTSRSGTEVMTALMVQVDVYTLDKDSTFDLAAQVDALLTPNGFRRSNAFPVTEGELERYQMTYSVNLGWNNETIL